MNESPPSPPVAISMHRRVASSDGVMSSRKRSPSARSDVRTTDLYVRFLPENEEQYQQLQALDIRLIDHPVDYQILKEGDYYHDPSVG